LSSVTDYFVHHNLGVEFPQDDSLVKITNNKLLILRSSRGFAPSNISDLIPPENGLLAMGAHLKSSFSLVPNDHIYTSQYLGNLDNFEVVKRFKDVLNKQIKLLNFSPTTIIIDSHPSYQSSLLGLDYATNFNTKISKVQHHKAHFASVLGEHNLFKSKEKILGVVWDGTGFGDDSAIWGGEFFIYESNSMGGLAHFEYFDWLANEKMAKEPRLSLFSLLR
jgi:hydrogenase maturation protein HypF